MAEVLWKNIVLELVDVLDGEVATVDHPVNDDVLVPILEYFEVLLDEVGNSNLILFASHAEFYTFNGLNRQPTLHATYLFRIFIGGLCLLSDMCWRMY